MKSIAHRDPCDISLLCSFRDEKFPGERAIRLFQFRSWLLFPAYAYYVNAAGFIAAAKYLDQAEDEYFWDEDVGGIMAEFGHDIDKPPQTIDRMKRMQQKYGYRKIFDTFIAKPGGLMALLTAPSPKSFDKAMRVQSDRIHIVSNLIDFRLRCVQHGWRDRDRISHKDPGANRALFFCWWPTHEIQGRRGTTPPSKSVSIKTMRTWWGEFERSALFLYLIHKYEFDQLPIKANQDNPLFVQTLQSDSANTIGLTSFVGAYAHLVDTFHKADGDLYFVELPASIKRIEIRTAPFSDAESKTIREYETKYLLMQ
jgi:hypothetical protein